MLFIASDLNYVKKHNKGPGIMKGNRKKSGNKIGI